MWKSRVTSENNLIGITKDDNVPLHLQHTIKLKPMGHAKPRPTTAVEEQLHRSAANEIKALEKEIMAEVKKRDKLEQKLKTTIQVSW